MKQYSDGYLIKKAELMLQNGELSEASSVVVNMCIKSLKEDKELHLLEKAREMLMLQLKIPKEVPKTMTINDRKYIQNDLEELQNKVLQAREEIEYYLATKDMVPDLIDKLNHILWTLDNKDSSVESLSGACAMYEILKERIAFSGDLPHNIENSNKSGRKR